MDYIFIEGFSGETVIGINDDELGERQPIHLDLILGKRTIDACTSDQIRDTVHYGEVHEFLEQFLKSHSYQLLEAFAEATLAQLFQQFAIDWARIKISKPHKFSNVRQVGVQIERYHPALNMTPSWR